MIFGLYLKELEAMTNLGDTSKGSSSGVNGWLFGVGVVLVWGAVLELRDWWVVNGERVRLVGIWVLGVLAVLFVAMAVVGVWAGRSDGLAGGRRLAGGWDVGRRVRIMVMRAAGGTRRPGGGLVQQRRRGDPGWSVFPVCCVRRPGCRCLSGWCGWCGPVWRANGCGVCRLIGSWGLVWRGRLVRCGQGSG